MEDLVKPAIQSVLVDGDIKLHPARFNNTYAHWLNNIRLEYFPSTGGDNKFRRIFMETKEDFVVAETIEEAFEISTS
jgi:valyl-tRNA synthetase